MDDLRHLLRESQKRRLAIVQTGWLAKAILLRSPNCTVQLAWSIPWSYSRIEIAIMERGVWN